jgi:hypothetical protein
MFPDSVCILPDMQILAPFERNRFARAFSVPWLQPVMITSFPSGYKSTFLYIFLHLELMTAVLMKLPVASGRGIKN